MTQAAFTPEVVLGSAARCPDLRCVAAPQQL